MSSTQIDQKSRTPVTRRTLFAGAGTLGAVAAAASLMPRLPEQAAVAEAAKPAPLNGGGYSLTDHVKRYYKTTRV